MRSMTAEGEGGGGSLSLLCIFALRAHNPITTAQAASYHLARRYEDAGKLKESLHFYRAARAYKNAIRIARQNNMAAEVMQLSLQADPSTLLESAEWFEEQGQLPKAVVLYKKGGELAKAIDLCVRGQLFDTLQKLADDLGPETDPEVYIQCAEFFVNEKQHEKAVRMYVNAKGFSEALQVCAKRAKRGGGSFAVFSRRHALPTF